MDKSFESEVDIDVYGPLIAGGVDLSGGSYQDITFDKVNVVWGIGLEFRDWGITSVDFAAPDQTIILSGSYYKNEDAEDDTPFSIELPVKDIKVEAKVEALEEGSLYPQTLEYHQGKWTLDFA